MKLYKKVKFIVTVIASGILIACSVPPQRSTETGQAAQILSPVISTPTAKSLQITSTPDTNSQQINSGLTYQQPDGNRFVSGSGNLPSISAVDIPLPGIPSWIVGVPFQNGVIWTVALEDGSIACLLSNVDGISECPTPVTSVSAGAPITSLSSNEIHSLVTVSDSNQSQFTHPVYLPRSDSRAYIVQNGDLKHLDAEDHLIGTLQINALLDARILVDEQDRLLLLTDPTQAYSHAVLGDNLEAKSFTIIDTYPTLQVSSHVTLNDHEVIEGIAPIWIDITGDGIREVVVTVSDLDLGAGIIVFSESGERAPNRCCPIWHSWRTRVACRSNSPYWRGC
jgi:hypothetical protein